MAAGWVKSLQCKSRAFDDVYHPSPKQPLLPSSSCRNSFQNLKDVIDNNTKPKPKPKSKPDPRRSSSVKPKPKPSPAQVRRTVSAPLSKGLGPTDPFFPSVLELQVGHPSRNVVEIIFHTRWGPKGFSGRVEMVFKIQNMPLTVSQFEEYRDSVRYRAGSAGCDTAARCSADGNEMMRFRCLGPTVAGGVFIDGGDCGGGGKGTGAMSSICTYSGSGAAHDSAGGGRGPRAMLVCRVIAGRVSKRARLDSDGHERVNFEFDSVSGDNGELLVFDKHAVLPCFLVIYKL